MLPKLLWVSILSVVAAVNVCPTADLNIRDSASTNGTILWVASPWDFFTVLAPGTWTHVQALNGQHKGQSGYASSQYLASCRGPGTAMPWMCLERCGESIESDFAQIKANRNSLTGVSPEAYDLGSSGNLIWNGFTRMAPQIAAIGLQTFPMITSANIDNLRILFNNDQAFINAAVSECVKQNYTGFHIDFEPCDVPHPTCTSQDAQAYAQFLDRFAKALHTHNKTINVAIATWNVFWDFKALGQTSVDLLITMGTYAYNMDDWQQELDFALKNIPLAKLGVGLCSDCVNTPYTDAEIQARFEAMAAAKVPAMAIWESPVPNNWWPWLQGWVNTPK